MPAAQAVPPGWPGKSWSLPGVVAEAGGQVGERGEPVPGGEVVAVARTPGGYETPAFHSRS